MSRLNSSHAADCLNWFWEHASVMHPARMCPSPACCPTRPRGKSQGIPTFLFQVPHAMGAQRTRFENLCSCKLEPFQYCLQYPSWNPLKSATHHLALANWLLGPGKSYYCNLVVLLQLDYGLTSNTHKNNDLIECSVEGRLSNKS